MDRAAMRRTLLIVSVEEVGGSAEEKYKVLTGCGYGIRGWMHCGGLPVGLLVITFGTTLQ